MSTQDIVQKLWNLCNVLRDDGITYHQYVTELTYILFLKMISENGTEKNLIDAVHLDYESRLEQLASERKIAVEELSDKEREDAKSQLYDYSWGYLASLDGLELKK